MVRFALNAWERFYGEPRGYAPDYTRWSRNFLNLGTMALLVSWFFASGLHNVRFAFADISESDVQAFKRVEGEWLYIGGRNPKGEGIVTPGTSNFLANVDAFIPARTGPQFHRKPAVGYVYPGNGIVQMDVDGITVLTVNETQAFYRRQAYIFLGLVSFAFVMFALSVIRQFLAVKRRRGLCR